MLEEYRLTQPDFYRPPLLKAGDRVRVVAPSGPISRAKFNRGVACLEQELGLQAVFDDGVFAREAYLAGSDERRKDEFLHALQDDTICAVWFARGGYGATRLLPHIPQRTIARQRRWLIGFSDATALHSLWQRAGLQSLHAAGITSLAEWSPQARTMLRDYLFTGSMPPLQGTSVCGKQAVTGPLLGGNLTLFAAMTGTGYLPDLSGCIVFFEDIGERPYRLDRSLTQLCQAGVFEGVIGFAIGQLTDCHDPKTKASGRNALEAICDVLQPLGVPIIAQLPVGHEPSSLPLALGVTAVLDPRAGSLAFVYDEIAGTTHN